jgi:hypothetical protein
MTLYDSKSWDLAEYFLADGPIKDEDRKRVTEMLAQEIQQCVEDFIYQSMPHLGVFVERERPKPLQAGPPK